MNPYESGAAAPAMEIAEKHHWTSLSSAILGGIAFACFAVLIGYITWLVSGIDQGVLPNVMLVMGLEGAWALLSLAGLILGAIGLRRRNARRGLPFFSMLLNLLLFLVLAALAAVGLSMGPT